MFRKLFIRLFLLCVCFTGMVVFALAIAGYLALQEPAYYADLRTKEFSKSDQLAVEVALKQIEYEFEHWCERSLAQQQMQRSKPENSLSVGIGGFVSGYDPAQDTHTIKVTQHQINTALASTKSSRSGDWRNPRIRFGTDRVEFAVEIASGDFRCVLSAELKPSVMADGRLRLDLLAAHVGQLPLPINTIIQWLPHDDVYADDGMELNLSGATPHVCWTLPIGNSKRPSVKSIQCRSGEVAIEMLAPVLPIEQAAAEDSPVAFNIQDRRHPK